MRTSVVATLASDSLTFRIRHSIYVLRRGQTERPEDMRRCDVFLVVEIRRENEEGAKAIAICHPLYRYDDERLTPELLGFPKKILGEGELVITNALAVVDPERIVCEYLCFCLRTTG